MCGVTTMLKTRTTLALLLVGLVAMIAVASTAAHPPKPKPWQWTETKVVTRLTAMGPTTFDAGEIGNNVYGTVCWGLGRGVLTPTGKRYTRFACTFRVGSTNGSYNRAAIVRTLPIGSGKLCIDVVATATYVFDASKKWLPITAGFITDPSRICP